MKDNVFYINKMIEFCDNIIEYTKEYDFKEFEADSKTFNACILCISQLGEIAKRLDENFCNKYSFIDWHSIRGTRNRFVHDYDGINKTILWEIVSENIPKLKEDLSLIINKI